MLEPFTKRRILDSFDVLLDSIDYISSFIPLVKIVSSQEAKCRETISFTVIY